VFYVGLDLTLKIKKAPAEKLNRDFFKAVGHWVATLLAIGKDILPKANC